MKGGYYESIVIDRKKQTNFNSALTFLIEIQAKFQIKPVLF